MDTNSHVGKVAFLGDYPPRQCGIATFTRDLRDSIAALHPEWSCPVVAVTDPGHRYDYPSDVRFEMQENEALAYVRAADFLNMSHAGVLCVQHEFGIFGGAAGRHVLGLLRRVRMPVVTTLHTVLREPNEDQRRVFEEIIALSSRVIVMTGKGREILRETWDVTGERVVIVPHGIPDVPFVESDFFKGQFGVDGRPVLLTFGLLGPDKGIEHGIEALAEIVREHPDVLYIILGATHPNLLRAEGETYRLSLERLARRLGVDGNVMFVNRYVDTAELTEFIGAADIYLTPYLNEAQITSGTLAYCFGAGKAVVSTPYWHAAELLGDGRGMLVPFRDSAAIAAAVKDLLGNEARRHAMRKQAYLLGREMIWREVASGYAATFEQVISEYRAAPSLAGARPAPKLWMEQVDLPLWRFDHLLQMTDSTGVLQHAIHSVPWFEHGYCTDDNARALLLTVLLEDLDGLPPELVRVQKSCAAFLQHAFNAATRRFRNFLSFDRRWVEETGSEDSQARALWALGAVVGRTRRESLRHWAAGLLEEALPAVDQFTSPRSWAFVVLGLHEYLRVLHGDLLAGRLRLELSDRLMSLFRANRGPDWPWLEDLVSYDNARVPHALILTGRWTEQPEMVETGLAALRWLQERQTGIDGCYRPIGSNGFWRRGTEPAVYDQQPLEAAASVSACIEAWHATNDSSWRMEAARAFDWYLGSNDLNLPVYDATNGGCGDGLHVNRVNQNQGAESTLSFLLALAEMRVVSNITLSFPTT